MIFTSSDGQLLDFDHWPEWLNTGLSITIASPNHKPGSELQHGDRLRSDFKGTVIKPKILVRKLYVTNFNSLLHTILTHQPDRKTPRLGLSGAVDSA
jgi:hypothetical protein